MTSVTVVVPTRGGELAAGAAEAVAESLDLAAGAVDCRVVIVGDEPVVAHEALVEAGFGDLPVWLCAAREFVPGRLAEALGDLVGDTDLVLLPASNDGRDLAPRLAAILERPFVSGALAVRASGATVSRGGGASLVDLEVDGPFVATLQPGARAVGTRDAGPPTTPTHVPAFAAFATAVDAEVIEVLPAEATTMDLAEAPFILGAGAGLGTPEDFARLEAVAGALGASTGATRVVTDAGWTTHDRQIGTTGVVVDPDCYVAFGISGAVQHTSGLGDPAHVVSVNVDPHCPMTSLADVAIVADAPAVVAALADRLGVATDTDRNTPGDSQGATP